MSDCDGKQCLHWGNVVVQRYIIVATRLGWVGVGGSEEGLSLLTLPRPSREAVLAALGDWLESAAEDAPAFGDLTSRLQRYFEGKRVTFSERLDLSGATPFQREVWTATRDIPYGETRSYAWVARRIGSPQAARAVGGALSRNHIPIIVPCHRVIASGGGLCGFGGGLELKRRLLALESAE